MHFSAQPLMTTDDITILDILVDNLEPTIAQFSSDTLSRRNLVTLIQTRRCAFDARHWHLSRGQQIDQDQSSPHLKILELKDTEM